MIKTRTNEGWHFQEMAFTQSLSVNGYDSHPLFDFLQIISMSTQGRWPWKSHLLCVASHLVILSPTRQTASQNILLQKTPLPSDLNSDVCSQKRGSDPENLQNLAKVHDREIFARSAIFSKLFTIPSCLPYQLFSSVVEQPCANFISLLLFCAEVISCSKIFLFLFRMNTVLDCSWCQPYRRYFFCISLFYERYIWLYLASATLPVFLLLLASLGSRCIGQTPLHMVGCLIQQRSPFAVFAFQLVFTNTLTQWWSGRGALQYVGFKPDPWIYHTFSNVIFFFLFFVLFFGCVSFFGCVLFVVVILGCYSWLYLVFVLCLVGTLPPSADLPSCTQR